MNTNLNHKKQSQLNKRYIVKTYETRNNNLTSTQVFKTAPMAQKCKNNIQNMYNEGELRIEIVEEG